MQRHPRTRLRVHRACTNADPKVGAKSEESSAFPVRRRNIIKTLSMTGTRDLGALAARACVFRAIRAAKSNY